MTEQKITPCLWFDFNAEEAVAHYLSIFPNSRDRVDGALRRIRRRPERRGDDDLASRSTASVSWR